MAKQRPVVLPDYPPILLKPVDQSNMAVTDQLLDALADHYRLGCRFSDLPIENDVTSFRQNKELQLWIGLAWGLMRDWGSLCLLSSL